jgi:ectoine hydroxylase-related dioxygenase (phytanoyl-CoA dioxygenase family)
MRADVDAIAARPDSPVQFVGGHIQQDPPPEPELIFRDVLANDAVVAVTHAVLGDGLVNVFYSGNTNLPGSAAQPVHHDGSSLWPGVYHPPPSLIVNMALVDTDETNGAIELWLGSHTDTQPTPDGSLRIDPAKVAARRDVRPPGRAGTKRGDVLIRDARLWHAGQPNLSAEPRPMIAMIHQVRWLILWLDKIELPAGSEAVIAHPQLRQWATFVDGPVDVTSRHTSHDVRA